MKKLFFGAFFCTFFLLLMLADSKNAEVRINEILSCNHKTLYDNTGAYHDYIEFYNNSFHSVDISGYRLSDSKKKIDKFIFPDSTIIAPKQYYLIWAGSKPSNVLVDNNYLYTGFSIKAGEKIYFSDKNGDIIDKIKVPKDIACDVSYSRSPVPYIQKWAKREPSPGKQNKLYKSNKKQNKVLENIKVEFSDYSGFFNEPFELKMMAPEGFDIYYTLDATKPTEKSQKYVAPIKIFDASENQNKYSAIDQTSIIWSYIPSYKVDKATIVRAIAVRKKDGAVSKENFASYFIGFQDKPEYKDIPTISVITNPENLFDYEKGIYVNGKIWDMLGRDEALPLWTTITNYSKTNRKKWARDMFVDYITDGKDTRLEGKMKIYGAYTRHRLQKSFTLFDLKKSDITDNIPFEFDLRSVSDFSRIKESLVYMLTKDRTEILPHPHKDIINLFLDGEFWGIYMVYDRLTPDFVAEKYGLKDVSLIDMQRNDKSYGNTEFKEEYESYEEIEKDINIDNLLSYVAINTYISNMDSCNLSWWNVVRWRSSENSRFNRWQWILYDVDNNNFFAEENQFKKNEICNLIVESPLLEKLFSSDVFRKKFIVTFSDIANYNFNPQKVNRWLDEFEDKYKEAVISSFRRFERKYFDEENFFRRAERIRNFYDTRFEYIMPYMKEYFDLDGELTEVYKHPSQINGGMILLNTLKLRADEEYRGKYYSDYDISLDVETFPGYLFVGWLIDGYLIQAEKLDLNIVQPREIEAVWIEATATGENEK